MSRSDVSVYPLARNSFAATSRICCRDTSERRERPSLALALLPDPSRAAISVIAVELPLRFLFRGDLRMRIARPAIEQDGEARGCLLLRGSLHMSEPSDRKRQAGN